MVVFTAFATPNVNFWVLDSEKEKGKRNQTGRQKFAVIRHYGKQFYVNIYYYYGKCVSLGYGTSL